MLAHQYQIISQNWGKDLDPEDPREKRYIGIHAIAKRDRESDFEVFNELVAMRLGQLLGLPIPAGMVVSNDAAIYFASCHILAAGGNLPPADLDRFAKERSKDACGVMVLDAWIANEDRHDENIWFDYYDDKFFIFDHGNSLLCSLGEQNLHDNKDRLGIKTGDVSLSHFISSFDAFSYWYERVMAIPTSAIAQAIREASQVGISSGTAAACEHWLLSRRKNLPSLFRDSLDQFPKAHPNLIDPFGDCDDSPAE